MVNNYPSEIEKLLRLGTHAPVGAPIAVPSKLNTAASQAAAVSIKSGQAPTNLPIVDFEVEWTKPMADQVMEAIIGNQPVSKKAKISATPLPIPEVMPVSAKSNKRGNSKSWLRNLLVYPVIFIVSFSFFYVLFNFSSLVGQVGAWFDQPEDEQILQEQLQPFYTWMNGYFFSVGDPALLEPNNDIDKDGLSNLDEYKIRTNPTLADSDDDGSSDGIEVINSTNPWGQGNMTDAQKKIRENLDVILINNRVSYNSVSVAEHIQESNTDKYDLSKPGQLSIPKLKMQVPLVWTLDPKDFDTDLTKGVVHYPSTALPGENGTMYVSGHSSDYFWKKHPYTNVFAKINTLTTGDDVFVTVYGYSGESYTFRYQVTAENIYKPDDQAQFVDNSAAKLNLSTCWPIGTQKDRYVVSAQLVPL